MNEFDMKTSDVRAIYRFFRSQTSRFFGQKPFKNEFYLLDLILDQI